MFDALLNSQMDYRSSSWYIGHNNYIKDNYKIWWITEGWSILLINLIGNMVIAEAVMLEINVPVAWEIYILCCACVTFSYPSDFK